MDMCEPFLYYYQTRMIRLHEGLLPTILFHFYILVTFFFLTTPPPPSGRMNSHSSCLQRHEDNISQPCSIHWGAVSSRSNSVISDSSLSLKKRHFSRKTKAHRAEKTSQLRHTQSISNLED